MPFPGSRLLLSFVVVVVNQFNRLCIDSPSHILSHTHTHDRAPLSHICTPLFTPQEEEARAGDKPWGEAIGAAFAVNAATLIGILGIVPAIFFGGKNFNPNTKSNVMNIVLPAFACGALIATALFLILPESVHLLEGGHGDHDDHGHRMLAEGHDDHDDHDVHSEEEEGTPSEAEVAFKFGISILGGYFIPFVLSSLFPHGHHLGDHDSCETDGPHQHGHHGMKDTAAKPAAGEEVDEESDEAAETAVSDSTTSEPKKIDWSLASAILLGDFFHNFCDGIFIGAAFLLCDRTLAWTVTASTIFHELAQELADFFLLTNQVGFSTIMALVLNFASGTSVLLGVVIILANDIDDPTIGVLLCISAGVYFYLAFTEIAPLVNRHAKTPELRAMAFVMWVLGAIPIGLVLLNHEHC